MAADSDGTLKAVVICEGDLHDPEFPKKFRTLLGKLNSILDPPKRKKRLIKVNKVSAPPTPPPVSTANRFAAIYPEK